MVQRWWVMTMPQCHMPGTIAEKSLWHSSLHHTQPTTRHHSTTSGTTASVTSWVTTCGHAWPSQPCTRTTLQQGCQIGCHTTLFDQSYYTNARKSNLIWHLFLKLSMQNTNCSWSNDQWPTCMHWCMVIIAMLWWSATVIKYVPGPLVTT